MKLKPALEAAERRLRASAVGSPRMNAEVLLMFTLACDRAYLYAHPERELTEREAVRYGEALEERARGVPAQYITGHQEFWGLDLIVTPAVLIPRPETEHVVEAVLELVRTTWRPAEVPAAHSIPSSGPRIIDVGTGSGCIALALAAELPNAEILASDISADALEIARINAVRLQLSSRIEFLQGDLLAGITLWEGQNRAPAFDFVVANPPYVGEGEVDKVQREVRKFEPQQAVFAGHDGLDIIVRLIPQARAYLRPGGWLVLEIGYTQEQPVRALLCGWKEARTVPDLQGIPRVIAARYRDDRASGDPVIG
jgi:release factor glutamine methyltransferase